MQENRAYLFALQAATCGAPIVTQPMLMKKVPS